MILPEYNLTDPFIHRVPTVDYITLIKLCWKSIWHYLYRFPKVHPNYRFPETFWTDVQNSTITKSDIILVLFTAVFITFLRYYVVKKILVPYTSYLNIPILLQHKFPEAVWKTAFYLITWGFSLYVHIFSGRYNTFWDPLSAWEGWSEGHPPTVYWDIKLIYLVQASFYVHSIYATVFMDIWRKDSSVMFIHHFIALALIGLSYGSDHLLEGAFVVFLQDNTDMLLELTKVLHYSKKRENGEYYMVLGVLSNVSFVTFAVLWVICRLYYYPLKLLYMTLYGGVYLGPQDSPFYFYLGVMLILVQVMNIYWFNFIARMIIRVLLTGEEPEDNREFDTSAVSGIPKTKLYELAREGKLRDSFKSKNKKFD